MSIATAPRLALAALGVAVVVAGGAASAVENARARVNADRPTVVSTVLPSVAQQRAVVEERGDDVGHCLRVGFGSPWEWPRLTTGDLDRTFATARSAGSTFVRLGVEWSSIERTRGTYDWAATDRMVAAARANGQQVLALLYTTPEWARDVRGPKDSVMTPPADVEDFARFAGAAATRYGRDVMAWQVWNEPNIKDFWATGADPAAYTRLLRASYREIKRAQPGTTVVSGGLAPAETRVGHIAPTSFLSMMYGQGAAGSFDAYGVHPYTYPGLPSDPSAWNPWPQMLEARQVMTRNGDGAKHVWITEFGSPTGTSPKAVSPDKQAQIATAGITEAAKYPWIDALVSYTVRDNGVDPTELEDNFGVVRRDWTPKPAAAAIREAAGRLGCHPD